MQLDEELLPLEAELADLCPGEGVYLGAVLEDEHSKMGHGQVQRNSLVVLQQEREEKDEKEEKEQKEEKEEKEEKE